MNRGFAWSVAVHHGESAFDRVQRQLRDRVLRRHRFDSWHLSAQRHDSRDSRTGNGSIAALIAVDKASFFAKVVAIPFCANAQYISSFHQYFLEQESAIL
jgi:hypothetical protein